MSLYPENIRKEGKSANPFFCLMGIDVVTAGEGMAELRMEVRPDMYNDEGWLQAGILTALADEAIALALNAMLSHHESISAISETTSYFRGIREGYVIARSRVIKKGRRVAFAEAHVHTDDREKTLLSTTSAVFAIIPVR